MAKRLLLIIDPQFDFIEGSLKVDGAKDKMYKLSMYLYSKKNEYDAIAFTVDFHPSTHCSFEENGGDWPMHCVQHSRGASIFNTLLNVAIETKLPLHFFTKGTNDEKEEYSVFKNEKSKEKLLGLIEAMGIEEIDICGIAYDYCVGDTIKDAVKLGLKDKINVLKEYCPSIGEGKEMDTFLEDEGINVI